MMLKLLWYLYTWIDLKIIFIRLRIVSKSRNLFNASMLLATLVALLLFCISKLDWFILMFNDSISFLIRLICEFRFLIITLYSSIEIASKSNLVFCFFFFFSSVSNLLFSSSFAAQSL